VGAVLRQGIRGVEEEMQDMAQTGVISARVHLTVMALEAHLGHPALMHRMVVMDPMGLMVQTAWEASISERLTKADIT
jgi:hypothetical protein